MRKKKYCQHVSVGKCNDCARKYNKEWRKKNPKCAALYSAAYRNKHVKKYKDSKRKYYLQHKEITKAWRKNNYDKVLLINKKYYHKNKEKIAAKRRELRNKKELRKC